MPSPARFSDTTRQTAGYLLLGLWLMLAAAGFWMVEGRPAHARAQLASNPDKVERIERWGHDLGAGVGTQATLALLPSACGCEHDTRLLKRLARLADSLGLKVVTVERPGFAALPRAAGVVLFNPRGQLLFAGPLQSPLHCSGGRSLAELVVSRALDGSPPLWAPVLDEPCACLPLRA